MAGPVRWRSVFLYIRFWGPNVLSPEFGGMKDAPFLAFVRGSHADSELAGAGALGLSAVSADASVATVFARACVRACKVALVNTRG